MAWYQTGNKQLPSTIITKVIDIYAPFGIKLLNPLLKDICHKTQLLLLKAFDELTVKPVV